jgi:hypothetical protein
MGAYMLPAWRPFHVGFPGRNLMIIQSRTRTDVLKYPPNPERAL